MIRAATARRWVHITILATLLGVGFPGGPAAALAAPPAQPNGAAPAGEERTFTFSGGALTIYNLVGTLEVERSGGSDFDVAVRLRGEDAGRLRAEGGSWNGATMLRVIYPAEPVVYRSPRADPGSRTTTTLDVYEDGTFRLGDRRDGPEGQGSLRRVRVASWGTGLDARADIRVRVPAGKRLDVHWVHGDISVRGAEGAVRIAAAAAPIFVERGRGSLELEQGSGSVDLRDVEGAIRVETGSGEIALERLRGEDLSFETGSGGIGGSQVEAERLHVASGSGALRLSAVRSPEITMTSGSGDVTLEAARVVRSVRIETGSGDVSLELPASQGATIEVEGGRRTVVSNLSLTSLSRDSAKGPWKMGDGRGRVTIATGSGDVRLGAP